MINKYSRPLNSLFMLFALLGGIYILLVYSLLNNFSFSFTILEDFFDYCSSVNFYTFLLGIIGGIGIFIGGIKTLSKVITTHFFVKKLKTERKQNYRLINTKEKLAFVHGYFSPEIYISKSMVNDLSKNELDAVLAHEYTHIKNLDPLKKMVVLFVLQILPPFPGKAEIFNSYEVLSELHADEEAAMRTCGKSCLIRSLIKTISTKDYDYSLLTGFAFQNSRIQILTDKASFRFGFLLSTVGTALVAVSSLLYSSRHFSVVASECKSINVQKENLKEKNMSEINYSF